MDAPTIVTDPDVLRSYLSDAAHVPGGFAAGVAFPRSAEEVAAIVSTASAMLPVGAQSSLTGGATPRGEIVISTRGLTSITIDVERRLVRAGAGVPLARLQQQLAASGLWYPPVPTYDGAFVGGTVATNAAGAATFKYGTTRRWVEALTVVLANGQTLELRRGDARETGGYLTVAAPRGAYQVPVPRYTIPAVPKVSAGYFAAPGMDLVDLFVGSEGTLGVIVEATLRVLPRVERCVVLVTCRSTSEAVQLTHALRTSAQRSWSGEGALDVSAIEFIDSRSLAYLPDTVLAGAGVPRPPAGATLLLIQIEVADEAESALAALEALLADNGVESDPTVALPGDDSSAARLFELREAVPTAVNAAVGRAKQRDAEIQKTAGDFIVPIARLQDSITLYEQVFAEHGVDYAIWGHVSDGNLHPNVIPASRADMDRGRTALLEAARMVIAMGGSPLAEHGVGRSATKQQLLRDLYGPAGIDDMRAVKRVLDPEWKLASGVLFPPSG